MIIVDVPTAALICFACFIFGMICQHFFFRRNAWDGTIQIWIQGIKSKKITDYVFFPGTHLLEENHVIAGISFPYVNSGTIPILKHIVLGGMPSNKNVICPIPLTYQKEGDRIHIILQNDIDPLLTPGQYLEITAYNQLGRVETYCFMRP